MAARIRATWARLRARETGATAVEYALMVGFIAAVIVGAVTLLGQEVMAMFESVDF